MQQTRRKMQLYDMNGMKEMLTNARILKLFLSKPNINLEVLKTDYDKKNFKNSPIFISLLEYSTPIKHG